MDAAEFQIRPLKVGEENMELGEAGTHRDFHVVGALIILFVKHLKVVPLRG